VDEATLPCAGIIRTGSKGVLSPTRTHSREGPLASEQVYAIGRSGNRSGAQAATASP